MDLKAGTAASPGLGHRALVQLFRTADAVWDASRVFFAEWNLGPSQFNVLNVLHGAPDGLSQSDLSRELIVHRSNVTGLVDRLEKRGLVERKDVAGDRRAYRVVLTAEGDQLMKIILPRYYKAAESVWGDLSEARLSELIAFLAEAAGNARKTAEGKQGMDVTLMKKKARSSHATNNRSSANKRHVRSRRSTGRASD